MKKLLLLITITSLLITSCTNDDTISRIPQGDYKLTKEVMKNANGDVSDIYEYEYTNGLLTKKIRLNNQGTEYITTYFYDVNNKITHCIDSGLTTNFHYTGNQITSITKTFNATLYTQTFTYNSLGQLTKREQSQNGGAPNATYNYTYDNNSNISTLEIDSVIVCTYSYDNGHNPNRLVYLDELSTIYDIDYNNVVLFNIYIYTYEYNLENYPTKKANYGSNNVISETTEYTYQYL